MLYILIWVNNRGNPNIYVVDIYIVIIGIIIGLSIPQLSHPILVNASSQ